MSDGQRPAAGDWAGSLRLTPGARSGALRLQRPDVVGPLLHGCLADAVPGRVGAVFTLCAQAQAHTARLALAAAGAPPGLPRAGHSLRAQRPAAAPAAATASAQPLALATARDHLLRITQDWPATLALALGATTWPAWKATTLASCPLWRPGLGDEDRLRDLGPWLAQHLLGMPPADWLARHRAEPVHFAALWCQHTPLPTAAALRAVRPRAQALATPAQAWAWPLPADAARAQALGLARALASEAGFARQPHSQGQPRDTGPWRRTRHEAEAASPALAGAQASAWGRLISRLAELVALALPGPCPLVHGAVATGPRQGLAWAEMARGLLLHWVQLADSPAGPVVARYQVIAPTDWNGHPDGGLARSVAALAPDDEAGARLLALAYDPCVPVRVHRQLEGAAHA